MNEIQLCGEKISLRDAYNFGCRVRKTYERTEGDHPECWEFEGCPNEYGYIFVGTAEGTMGAHRLSYVIANGPFDTTLDICHACDNRKCVRPEHLYAATHAQNMRDAASRGRLNKRPQSVRKGVRYQSKWSDEDCQTVDTLYQNGLSLTQIGLLTGASATTVRYILINKTKTYVYPEKGARKKIRDGGIRAAP